MNETPTPRTDEAAVDVWRKSNGERMATSSDKVDADFARKLERELNETRAESIRWMSIAEGRGRCTLRGGPDAWVIGAWGDSITVTTTEDVMREVRDFLDDGCRTITIERQGAPDRTDSGCTPIVSEDQLATVTAQRDRLAVVLQQCREDSVELVTERDRINAIINTFSNQ
jgi:hypothetical protein